jgi:hypothetical protein
VLSQRDEKGRNIPARYGSLPLPDAATRYGQSKLELYGLFRALKAYRIHLVGVPELIVEVDASSIKGMLNNPDSQAAASVNRWIQGILLYDFTLVHVPGNKHRAPDALSRRRYTDMDEFPDRDSDDSMDDGITKRKPLIVQEIVEEEMEAVRVGIAQRKEKRWDKEKELQDIWNFLDTFKAPPTTTARVRQRFLSQAAQYY